ncbi:energy transducer TonB [Kordiimonas lacus]|nr:energy transducer TonB [Kordiimonas lacus]
MASMYMLYCISINMGYSGMLKSVFSRALISIVAMSVSASAMADEPQRPLDPMWQNSACVNPMMPRLVIKKRLTGHTSALFDITDDGKVKNIRITDSEPKGAMDGAVKRALKRWSYFLYFEDGYAAPRKDVPITFTFGEGGDATCTHIPLPELPSTAGDPVDPYVQLKQCTMLVMQQKEARKEISGSVTLRYDISKDGKVENIQVVKSTPEGVFDDNAQRALERWKYHEFKIAGEPIERPDMQVDFFFGALPDGASDNRCGYAPWDATNVITAMEFEEERQQKPGVKVGRPSPSHGKN